MSEKTEAAAGRYQLKEPLGQGGQGRTFRAIDTQSGKAVAVKVINLRGGSGWKSFDLFERECAVLRSLEHPSIPRYLDTFAEETEGRYYLVMELVQGTPLQRHLDEHQRFSEAQLWNILHQSLEILDYLHGRLPPVIHRDLKPANLIQSVAGGLFLVDFGGVRLALRPDGGSTVVGTFGYMAPEQLHGEATPATDLYGLGATLAALAAGTEADKLPRQGLTVDLSAVMSPSPLRDLLQRMLEPDPRARPPSATAVRELARQPGPEAAPGLPVATRGGSAEEPDLTGLAGVMVRLFGTLGHVGLVLMDVMVLPVIFFILNLAWAKRPRRLGQLREHERTIREAVGRGRRSMRELSQGRGRGFRRRRDLPGRSRRQLPPRP